MSQLDHLIFLVPPAGITPLHTRGDKVISRSLSTYSYLYGFLGALLGVAAWHAAAPWPKEWWGTYFLIVFPVVPTAMAAVTAVWFRVGGALDLRNLFRDLQCRTADDLDNAMVVNGVSMADHEKFRKLNDQSKP